MGFWDIFRKQRIFTNRPKEEYRAFDLVKELKGSYSSFHSKLIEHSLIMLIAGKRGSGKTALGMKFLELFRNKTKRKCYVLGYEKTRLPMWIKKAESIDSIPENAIALVDEGALTFSARDSMNKANKELSRIMTVARHKNLSLILITQSSAMIDLNVLRLADTLLFKEPSLLQSKFERKAIKDMYEKVIPYFQNLDNKHKHFYLWDDEFEGLLSYNLPGFWSEKISKSFK